MKCHEVFFVAYSPRSRNLEVANVWGRARGVRKRDIDVERKRDINAGEGYKPGQNTVKRFWKKKHIRICHWDRERRDLETELRLLYTDYEV